MLFLLPISACSSSVLLEREVDGWEIDAESEAIPFGFWGLNGFLDSESLADLGDRYRMTAFHTSSREPVYTVTSLLPLVRDAGLQVNLRMVGDHTLYTTEGGDFDIDAWKGMLAPWHGSGVQEFIDDGTLLHQMLLDDITEFDGAGPTGDELDEMARYSKELLPGLTTLVREEASELPLPTSGRFEHLDGAINQYHTSEGDIAYFAVTQRDAAAELGLGIVNSLNIANGGDGSSGQPGWESSGYAMSAAEIVTYGEVLSKMPGCTMLLNWEYDGEEVWSDGTLGSVYFDQPDLTQALARLGELAARDL